MRVGLFVTCLVDLMRPRIGMSALTLLERAGCEVVVPTSQTCCGQPGYNSGDRAGARRLAEKFIAEFEGCEYVVAPSGSCAGMVKTHYPELFADAPEWSQRVSALAARTYELTDFLHRIVKLYSVPGEYRGTVTYHDSCSGLRELSVQSQPRALLAMVPGLQLKEMNEAQACCGFGGTFALKFGDVSTRIVDVKCDHIAAAKTDAVVLGDLGCMLNIEGRLRRRGDETTQVLHVAEILAGEVRR
jgi:L-lactate dehydrogenase complex protein LldE